MRGENEQTSRPEPAAGAGERDRRSAVGREFMRGMLERGCATTAQATISYKRNEEGKKKKERRDGVCEVVAMVAMVVRVCGWEEGKSAVLFSNKARG